MDVDRGNWSERLPQVLASVGDADFFALDLEMSGLSTSKDMSSSNLDTMQDRWSKTKDSCENLAVLQLGLCACRWEEKTPGGALELVADPFNFWVFPRTYNNGKDGDVRLTFQAGSIEFLSSCGFDFTRALSQGISYVDNATAEAMRARLERRMEERLASGTEQQGGGVDLSTVRGFAASCLASALQSAAHLTASNQVAETTSDPAPGEPESAPPPQSGSPSYCIHSTPEGERYIVLSPFNGYVRRLIYQEVPKAYPHIHVAKYAEDNSDRRFGGDFSLRLTLCKEGTSPAELERRRVMQDLQQERLDMEAAIGLNAVIAAIVASKKPVIGHNLLLDLGHVFSKFISGRTLPSALEDFRALANETLPMVVDTKYLFETESTLKSMTQQTSLSQLYTASQQGLYWSATNPQIRSSAPCFQRYFAADAQDDSLHHEAGYDALMTAVVYARALCRIGMPGFIWDHQAKVMKPKFPARLAAVPAAVKTGAFGEVAQAPPAPSAEEAQAFHRAIYDSRKHLFNKIYAFRIGDIKLDQPNVEPSRSLLVRLCNFPPEAKTFDLQRIAGQAMNVKDVRISWEHDTAAFLFAPDQRSLTGLLRAYANARDPADVGKIVPADKPLTLRHLDVIPWELYDKHGRSDSFNYLHLVKEMLDAEGVQYTRKRGREDNMDDDEPKKKKSTCTFM